jgi:hypothetical protein
MRQGARGGGPCGIRSPAARAPICCHDRRAPTAGPREMSLCVICHGPLEGPSLLADDARRELHPACLAERLPYDAGVALVAAAALFVIPLIRVWSA